MVEIVNSAEAMTFNEASDKYQGYYYLMVIPSEKSQGGTKGIVYAISDQEGIDELVEMENELQAEGKKVLIGDGDDESFDNLEIVGIEVFG